MTCPTITTLHAILAAHEAPQGPSKADTIKAVAECLSGACAPATFDLHAAIMNIPADHAKACGTNNAPAYKIGHRDARHAAAELAIQAQPVAAQGDRDKLLSIIASAYQVAGAHGAPAHILDVLADPEAATAAQVEAMLPYQVAAQGEQDALLVALEGEHAACDWLMARLISLDPFFKPTASPAWPAIAAGSAAILAAKGGSV